MATIHHRLEYTASAIPLEQVIDALQAQQKLLGDAIAVLAKIDPNSHIRIAAITIASIQEGSLLTDLILQLYGFYQKDIDRRTIEGIESLIGVHVPKEYEALVTLLMIGVTFFVAQWAVHFVTRRKKLPHANPDRIVGDYNVVVNIVARKLVLSPDVIRSAIEGAVPPQRARQLVKSVAALFRPAKQKPGSEIRVPEAVVAPATIAEFPSDADLQSLIERDFVDYPDTVIEIRAIDRDRLKSGWAAKLTGIPDYADRRVSMDLYPTVDAEALAALTTVRADIILETARDAAGNPQPKRLHLIAFREVEDDKP